MEIKYENDKKSYPSNANIFLLPSSWCEGLPYVLLKDAAYGLTLISIPVDAVSEILYDGQNCLFIKPGNIPILIKTLERLIADRAMVLDMDRESIRICKNRFSIQKLKINYDTLFDYMDSSNAITTRSSSHV